MRIAIITPVFNGLAYLNHVLCSVRSQGFTDLEYIVCDGGSTDGSRDLLEENRYWISKLIFEKDSGMYDALVKGFRHATGDVLGWINSDDLLMPWCLDCVAEYFDKVPECQWLTGVPSLIDAKGRMIWTAPVAPRYRRTWIRRGWYSGIGLGPIQQESTFFRRSLYEKVGGINPRFRLAGDFDLWRRFAEHADLHQLGTVIAGFRMHGKNLTANPQRYFEEAGARRIPGGKVLGALYSFLAFLAFRVRKSPRFDYMALRDLKRGL